MKESFKQEYDELNKERERLYDIYTLSHGYRLIKPIDAFKIFCEDLASMKIKNIKEARQKLEQLLIDKKEEYQKKKQKDYIFHIGIKR